MSITTRFGDQGQTRLFSGETVSKSSSRPDAYGDLDELVSQLGVVRSLVAEDSPLGHTVPKLQEELFVVGAELATTPPASHALAKRVDEAWVSAIDARLREAEASLPPATGFILPGGSPSGAHLDVARALCRRLERKVVALAEAGDLDNPHLLVWLNRLSDLLWLMARLAENGQTRLKDQ